MAISGLEKAVRFLLCSAGLIDKYSVEEIFLSIGSL
jgi:hypothetical protein